MLYLVRSIQQDEECCGRGMIAGDKNCNGNLEDLFNFIPAAQVGCVLAIIFMLEWNECSQQRSRYCRMDAYCMDHATPCLSVL